MSTVNRRSIVSTMDAATSSEAPLRFHHNPGQNAKISSDSTVARRTNCSFFARGLVFGNRPIKANERISFKLVEATEDLGGFIYVGFTSRDPENMKGITCGQLSTGAGYWSWFFPKDLCSLNTPLFYYVTDHGEVYYGVEDIEKGQFGKIKIQWPLWALFDIYGNSKAIKIIDPPSLGPLVQGAAKKFLPLMLHKNCSRNVKICKNQVQRMDNKYSQGYVFTYRPLQPDEVVAIQISPNRRDRFQGLLHMGVTSCDPATLNREDLPDNANSLVDRPEYWVLICDFTKLTCGDQINLTLSPEGQLNFRLNGGKFGGVVHVDQTLQLWLFLNIYGTTQPVHLLSCHEGGEETSKEKECVVCYDAVVETALYRCGHTCMCYECAMEQWQGKGDGHCPLCRAVIRDVIRINK